MKRIVLFVLIIAGLFLSACQGKADSSSAPVASTSCNNGVCIKGAYASVDEEYFIVLFDITPIEGIESTDSAPQIVIPMQVLIKGSDETVYVDDTFTQEEYYCYAGEDVPWASGILTATCGIGIPITEGTLVPESDDEISIGIPEFNNYQASVTVSSGW
jgi:hypothetical protein